MGRATGKNAGIGWICEEAAVGAVTLNYADEAIGNDRRAVQLLRAYFAGMAAAAVCVAVGFLWLARNGGIKGMGVNLYSLAGLEAAWASIAAALGSAAVAGAMCWRMRGRKCVRLRRWPLACAGGYVCLGGAVPLLLVPAVGFYAWLAGVVTLSLAAGAFLSPRGKANFKDPVPQSFLRRRAAVFGSMGIALVAAGLLSNLIGAAACEREVARVFLRGASSHSVVYFQEDGSRQARRVFTDAGLIVRPYEFRRDQFPVLGVSKGSWSIPFLVRVEYSITAGDIDGEGYARGFVSFFGFHFGLFRSLEWIS